MTKKESFKLTKKQLKELKQTASKLSGLRQVQLDIAEKMGELRQEIWYKIHKMLPDLEDKQGAVNWETGEVTQKEDC